MISFVSARPKQHIFRFLCSANNKNISTKMQQSQQGTLSQYYHTFDQVTDQNFAPFSAKKFQAECLRTEHVGRHFYHVNETSSTMDLMDALCQPSLPAAQSNSPLSTTGAPTGFLVLADVQTAGKGRKGRVWQSSASQNLYFSLLFRLQSSQFEQLIKLNLGLSLATVKACHELGATGARIKWPNDIWVPLSNEAQPSASQPYGHYRKLSGMLINSSQMGDEMRANCGIGINVNQPIQSLKEQGKDVDELKNTGISLSDIVGKTLSRELVLATICNQLEDVLSLSLDNLLTQYTKYDLLTGKQVYIHESRTGGAVETREGIAVGYSKFGNLRVQFSDGSGTKELLSEEVSIRL